MWLQTEAMPGGAALLAFPPPVGTWGCSSFYAETKPNGDKNSPLHSTLPARLSFLWQSLVAEGECSVE